MFRGAYSHNKLKFSPSLEQNWILIIFFFLVFIH